MNALIDKVMSRARLLGVPFSVHLDLTYRCNERCRHCYLEHGAGSEMPAAQIKNLLDELAEAGVFFLTLSGGEPFLRADLFEILEHARKLTFCVRLKTNASLIGAAEADRIASLGINEVHVSVYSGSPVVHDRLTLLPGSWQRTIDAVRLMRSRGQNVILVHIVTSLNAGDHHAVQALAGTLGTGFRIDATIIPKLDGDRSTAALNVPHAELVEIVGNPAYAGRVEEVCAPDSAALSEPLCAAAHNHCYISPDGGVFPCVQLPLLCGRIGPERFLDIWRESAPMKEVRAMRLGDLPVCSLCSHAASCWRCPGLALLEGDLRGPSALDCERSYARTGVAPTGWLRTG